MMPTEELADHFDVFNPDHAAQMWEVLKYSRQHCPVLRTDADPGYLIISRYEDIRYICEHPEIFSNSDPAVRGNPVKTPPLTTDPPDHAEFRRLLNPYLSRSFLLRHADVMRSAANQLIDRFIDAGECEFMHDFATPFTSSSLARVILDDPNEIRLSKAIDIATRIGDEGTPELFIELAELADEYLNERAASAGSRDDIVNAILTGHVYQRALTRNEMVGIVTVLFSGGLDTTKGALGNIVSHLAVDSTIEARLRDPAWIRRDMDEFLRYESPVLFLARTVTIDTELAGRRLRSGDRLVLHFGSANRDEAKFDRSNELWFDRQRNPHAAFGLGIHRCIGLNFARLQIEIAFDELLKRITNVRLAAGKKIEPAHGVVLSPQTLPIVFSRRAGDG